MAKLYEVVIVVAIWAIVLTSYASIIGSIIVIFETNPISSLLVVYFLFNMYYHLNAMGNMQLNDRELINLFFGSYECRQLQSVIGGCTAVYLTGDKLKSAAVDVNRFNTRYLLLTSIVKVGILLTFIGWYFAIDSDSGVQMAFFVTMVVTQSIMAFLFSELVVICIGVISTLPFLVIHAIYMCIWDSFGKPHGRRRQNVQRPVQVQREPHPFLVNPDGQNANAQLVDIMPVQVEPMVVVRQGPQVHPEHLRFDQVERTTTNKAMETILTQWKRTFSIGKIGAMENGGVCLEDFNQDEVIIELKGNKAHIFHPKGLENWAGRNRGCPLCRKDFVEMARNEATIEQLQNEMDV